MGMAEAAAVVMVAVAAHTSAAEECAAAAAEPISAVGCGVAVRISVVVVYDTSAAGVCDTTAVAAGGTSVAGPQDRDILRGRFPVAIVQWPSAMHPAI